MDASAGATDELARIAPAAEEKSKPAPKQQSVEQIAKAARDSIVVITVTGRDGRQHGLGTGFVVAKDGLIATNYHVLGEARPITVQTADGTMHQVISIHASNRHLDLALIRIDAKNLAPLELGDSDQLKQGQPVVALGNPQGLKHSVVAGNISGEREFEGRKMIQLAIPIEPGNSGGPMLDMQGRVQGILTMKSTVTDNLGFAVAINTLKPLIEKPNPIKIERWLTIGALDEHQWKTIGGAQWRQRAGRIHVSGSGREFGGRSLCIWQADVPQPPYELGVLVKLDEESGAAGLVFSSDSGDLHYGFYPSNGRLRLSRFEGPSVFSWKVLAEKASEHYRPGDWNALRVRVEPGKILAYVNDHKVFESTDKALVHGKVGLAKFRHTKAQFKNFRVGKTIRRAGATPEVVARVKSLVVDVSPTGDVDAALVDKLHAEDASAITALSQRARLLEQQATQLRRLAVAVHQRRVRDELVKLFKADTQKADTANVDLLRAALLVARHDNDEVDVEAYLKEVDRMAGEIRDGLKEGASEQERLAAMNQYLFEENGFHGSHTDYYNKANSYLNEVIDDREGLPIALSVLYMELARRLDLKVVGVGLPGHFVVKFVPAKGDAQLIDPFEGGKTLSRVDAAARVLAALGRPFAESDLDVAGNKAIVLRMFNNLIGVAQDGQHHEAVLGYLNTMIAIDPASGRQRIMRAITHLQRGRPERAREDVLWVLKHEPDDVDLGKVRQLLEVIDRNR
ncbi:MAG: trypsin-like peptidase domain-containing protein [Planctomycetes bacterium]|nr:trypsin-like peptidase domain-containing protein [Planctomycetota bacterium]